MVGGRLGATKTLAQSGADTVALARARPGPLRALGSLARGPIAGMLQVLLFVVVGNARWDAPPHGGRALASAPSARVDSIPTASLCRALGCRRSTAAPMAPPLVDFHHVAIDYHVGRRRACTPDWTHVLGYLVCVDERFPCFRLPSPSFSPRLSHSPVIVPLCLPCICSDSARSRRGVRR